jgi:RND family efflux transporter, MFP subunit
MKRAVIVAVLAVVVLFGIVFGLHRYQEDQVHRKLAASADPAVVVSDAPVTTVNHAESSSAVGQIMAVQGAPISSAVGGVVESVGFHSGMKVKAGQVLLTLNAGALPGQLEQAEAKAHLAAIDANRQRGLYGVKGTSQANYDTATYAYESDQAAVAALKQSLAQYTITAPFAGVAGLRTLDAGAYVHPGDIITDLENLDQLYVDFSIPQKDIALVHIGAPVSIAVHAGDATRHVTAHVTAVDSHVSMKSRAMSVRAVIHDQTGLFPGMFTMVTIESATAKPVVTVPMVAVSFNTFGDFVYVVDRSGGTDIAREQPVKVGAQFGGRVEVLSGVKPGMNVVTAGQVKLHSGDKVIINNAVSLEAQS